MADFCWTSDVSACVCVCVCAGARPGWWAGKGEEQGADGRGAWVMAQGGRKHCHTRVTLRARVAGRNRAPALSPPGRARPSTRTHAHSLSLSDACHHLHEPLVRPGQSAGRRGPPPRRTARSDRPADGRAVAGRAHGRPGGGGQGAVSVALCRRPVCVLDSARAQFGSALAAGRGAAREGEARRDETREGRRIGLCSSSPGSLSRGSPPPRRCRHRPADPLLGMRGDLRRHQWPQLANCATPTTSKRPSREE